MLLLRSSAAMARALDSPLDEGLRELLLLRQSQLNENDKLEFSEVAFFLIVEVEDDLGALEAQLGFSPLVNPMDDTRYGDPDFTPWWDWIEDHNGWFELVFVLTDDGFAHVVLIRDGEGLAHSLLSLCREQTVIRNIQNELTDTVKSEAPEANQPTTPP